jgi:predicted nucleic acid-binding protein
VSAVYVDSSAIVKLVIAERESEALGHYLTSAGQLTTSILAVVEVARAVERVAPGSAAATAAVFESVAVIGLDARIAARAGSLNPAALGTLDAIHLATAIALGVELTAFISYDEKLSVAARGIGLTVIAPA